MKNTKRTLSIVLILAQLMLLCGIAAILPASAAGEEFDVWDGTSIDVAWLNDPVEAAKTEHIVDTAAKLAAVARLTNEAAIGGNTGAYAGHTFYITKNIDLNNKSWDPIGRRYGTNFAGNIIGKLNNEEGKSVTIKNMYIADGYWNGGFVGTFRGGAMKNITFLDCEVLGSDTIGVAAGYISKLFPEFENVVAINCTVIANDEVGGLIGGVKTSNPLTLKNCAFIGGEISTSSLNTGGLVGILQENTYTFENCYSSANMVGIGSGVGGFVGRVDTAGILVTFKNCQFDGIGYTPISENSCGAFVGDVAAATLNFQNCLSTGLTHDLAGSRWIAKQESGTVVTKTNCYANSNLPIYGTVLPTALTSDQLLGDAAKTNMTGLDFDTVWTARAGKAPVLTVAKDITLDLFSTADLTWFDPTSDEMTVDTANELLGYAMLACLTEASQYNVIVDSAIKDQMVEPLFSAEFIAAYNQLHGNEETTDEVTTDTDEVTTDTDEVTTDDAEVTTDKEEVTTVKKDDETDDKKDDEEKKGGCGSVAGGIVVGILALAAIPAVCFKKKED